MKKFLKTNNIAIRLIIGTICSLIISLVLVLLFSLSIVKYDFDKEIYKYFWYVISVLSSMIGAIACVCKVKSKMLLSGLLLSVITSILILLTLLVFSDFNIDMMIFFNIPACFIGGVIGSLIAANKR